MRLFWIRYAAPIACAVSGFFIGRSGQEPASAPRSSVVQVEEARIDSSTSIAQSFNPDRFTRVWDEVARVGLDKPEAEERLLAQVDRGLASDPSYLLRMLLQSVKTDHADLLTKVWKRLRAEHFPLALAALLEQPDLLANYGIAADMMRQWATLDPQSAWAAAIEHRSRLQRVVEAAAQGWTTKNPVEAAKFGFSLSDERLRSDFGRSVLNRWGQDDAGAMMAWIKGDPTRSIWLDLVDWKAVKLKSEAQLAELLALAPADLLNKSYSGGFTYYESEDWSEKLDWILRAPDSAGKSSLLRSALRNLALDEPEKAQAYLSTISDTRTHELIQSANAGWKATRSPQEALEYAQGITDPEARDSATGAAVLTWAMTDPEAAASYHLASSLHKKDSSLMTTLVHNWAGREPAGATKFVLANNLSADDVFQTWVGRDAQGASEWVLAMPTGPQRDQASAALAKSSISFDSTSALAWVDAIQDHGARAQALASCIQSWAQRDANAAKAWMSRSSFDETTRKALQKAIERAAHYKSRSWSSNSSEVIVR
jgi:hypothetical protein